jgi:predicted nuclease with RNAse H fold
MKVFGLKGKVIIGIDLAGKSENPTGCATWKDKEVKTALLHTDSEILEVITRNKPEIIAIDAPFSLPRNEILRKADKEMIKHGYRVFPPSLPAMKQLTMRAIKLNMAIAEKGFKTIEVHPTSTCKALNIPLKDWGKIQTVLEHIGLEGDFKVRALTSHESDAVLAALTAYLHIKKQTEALGDEEEGYIIIPQKQEWRTIKL